MRFWILNHQNITTPSSQYSKHDRQNISQTETNILGSKLFSHFRGSGELIV